VIGIMRPSISRWVELREERSDAAGKTHLELLPAQVATDVECGGVSPFSPVEVVIAITSRYGCQGRA
jgi:hypothetical protein